MELAAGISGYVLRNEAKTLIKDTLLSSMEDFHKVEDKYIADMWNKVQSGVSNKYLTLKFFLFYIFYFDSLDAVVLMVTKIGGKKIYQFRFHVASCLQVNFLDYLYNNFLFLNINIFLFSDATIDFKCGVPDMYKTSCLELFGDYIKAHAVSLGAGGLVLAFIQVSSFSLVIAKNKC